MRRHRTCGPLLGTLLLLFLLTGQAAAAFHHHGALASRRNCPVCVQSAHDAAVPGAAFRMAFHTHLETASPEKGEAFPATSAPAPPDARSPPSRFLSA